jgi:hypothetical protein
VAIKSWVSTYAGSANGACGNAEGQESGDAAKKSATRRWRFPFFIPAY